MKLMCKKVKQYQPRGKWRDQSQVNVLNFKLKIIATKRPHHGVIRSQIWDLFDMS